MNLSESLYCKSLPPLLDYVDYVFVDYVYVDYVCVDCVLHCQSVFSIPLCTQQRIPHLLSQRHA